VDEDGTVTIVVVGGGILGLAVARELSRRRDGDVVVLEKEDRLAAHQTGHNSGVVHAGLYYRPGSLKAQLCTRGRDLLREHCVEQGLPYGAVGKLVVAVRAEELTRLDAVERTATENRVPGLRRLDRDGLREIEPHADGLRALHSPATAITDFAAVARSFATELASAGGRVRLRTEVTGMRHTPSGVELTTRAGPVHATGVVVCGGLQADRLGLLAGGPAAPRILPFRGEYLRVRTEKRDLVRGLIYPVPDPRYPFLGVHFTRMVDGSLEVGPNAVLAAAREGYRRHDVTARDLRDTVTWPGTWSLARTHWRTGARELAGSLSVRAYLRAARAYVPEIGPGDVSRARAGVRAQAVDRDGTLVDDFRIDVEDRVTVVRNAPSPAATSSLAIAEWVVDRMAG
jgi:L-2-hydroxyglutarate oxidase